MDKQGFEVFSGTSNNQAGAILIRDSQYQSTLTGLDRFIGTVYFVVSSFNGSTYRVQVFSRVNGDQLSTYTPAGKP